MDLVYRRALEPHVSTDMTAMDRLDEKTREWLDELGIAPRDERLWVEALTHASNQSARNYERLEFLGDRVLALAVAHWLYRHDRVDEGRLALRMNALVARATCARIAQAIDLAPHIVMGRQASEDGGRTSTNILGDVIEAMIGAHFLEQGYESTARLIERWWAREFSRALEGAKHPKSALQEWAAGNRRKPPVYEVIERSGPDHAARFTVRVSVANVGEAQATASSKSEAEKRAAAAFLEQYG